MLIQTINEKVMMYNNEFDRQVENNIKNIENDNDFRGLTNVWVRESIRHSYSHNFSWLGRPVIQVPQDVYAVQELIWKVKPDLVIETGIAHGGSLILSASLLALLDYCDAVNNNKYLVPFESKRRVIGVDIDIRAHNRQAITEHPMAHLIEMIEGSSVSETVVNIVKNRAQNFKKILVFLDSNHTHDHVLAELEAYAPLVSLGSYCVVWDSGIEDLPTGFITDRPWGKGNNPKTALFSYINKLNNEVVVGSDGCKLNFCIDKTLESKIMITASTDGFLKRV